MRSAAADALGYFSSAAGKIIRPLLQTLKDDSVEVRRATVLSLSRIGHSSDEVAKALKELSEDQDSMTRLAAKIGLANLGKSDNVLMSDLLEGFRSTDESTADLAVTTLITVGKQQADKVVQPITEALEKGDSSSVERAMRVLRGLKVKDEKVTSAVAAVYDRVDSKTRVAVLQTLKQMDSAGAAVLPLCVKGLSDSDPSVRKEALLATTRYKSKLESFKGSLFESLKDEDEEIKLMSMGIVRGLGDQARDAVPTLVSLTKDPSRRIRIAAVNTPGSVGTPDAPTVKGLEAALKDQDENVRIACVTALKTIGRRDPQLVAEVLRKALVFEKDERAKRHIVSSLNALSSKPKGKERQ